MLRLPFAFVVQAKEGKKTEEGASPLSANLGWDVFFRTFFMRQICEALRSHGSPGQAG